MDRRVEGGGRPWRPRGAVRDRVPPPSLPSSSSHRDRWRNTADDGKGGRGLRDVGGSVGARAEPVADVDVAPLVGTCPDMCPAKERTQREKLRDLAVFERVDGNPARTSVMLAVKKFCRTMSTMDVEASDIRPLPVLRKTLAYLLHLVDYSDNSFEVIHDFVFDRCRSIRQDLCIQNIVNSEVIHMYEEMVKFHITSDQSLRKCSGKLDVSSLLHLNKEQLVKSLTTLYDLYAANRKSGSRNCNEAEFYSFHVLLQLGNKGQERDSISLWFRTMEMPILQTKEMKFVRNVWRCFQMGNYQRFFKAMATESTYLQFCLLESAINEKVRAWALSYINYGGYRLHPYPLADLSRVLMLEETDLESLCHACGLETSQDEEGCLFLPAKQPGFHMPKAFQNFNFLDFENLKRWEAHDGRTKQP